MVTILLMAMPDDGPAITSLSTGPDKEVLAYFKDSAPAAAQAALWKSERERGIKDPAAWTANANISIAALEAGKAAPPGAVLGRVAAASAERYYRMEEKHGVHDPDALPEADNILEIHARASSEAWRRKRGITGEDSDLERGSITKYLQQARDLEHGAVEVTEHPLSNAHGSSDDMEAQEMAHIKGARAREKAAEEKYLAKEQAARTIAAGKSGKSSKDTVSAETHNERSKTAEVASAKADHEIKPTSEAVTIVRGSTHLANPRNSSAPKNPNPGMLCLQDGGLSEDEMQAFAHSTVCVGWHIKKGMGLGDTKDMIRVRLCLPAILYVHPGSCVIS
jgi:hypothetical protein